MVPAMIYLIGMPTAVVVGTSLFQICFVAAITGFLQAYANHSVDILLALLLIAGGVVGAQFGTRFAGRLRAEQTRALLALLVLLVCGKLAWDLVVPAARPVLAQLRLTRPRHRRHPRPDHGLQPLPELSIVVPAYNEEAVLVAFHRRLAAELGWAERARRDPVRQRRQQRSHRWPCSTGCARAIPGSPCSTCRATSARRWR